MTTSLPSWASALGGTVSGTSILCPGPGHSRKDRSLAVRLSASAPDGFLVYSHAGDDFADCRDFVRAKLGLPAFSHREARWRPCRAHGWTSRNPHRRPMKK